MRLSHSDTHIVRHALAELSLELKSVLVLVIRCLGFVDKRGYRLETKLGLSEPLVLGLTKAGTRSLKDLCLVCFQTVFANQNNNKLFSD